LCLLLASGIREPEPLCSPKGQGHVSANAQRSEEACLWRTVQDIFPHDSQGLSWLA
ncbi:hypothetical protein HispidOSU_021259, partial [Sigmodon hispidus]